MWVYEEMVEGRKLTEIINEDHENVKYLPGVKLPENVVAVPELLDAARDADLFIFVIPHQFISRLVGQMKGNIKAGAAAISLIKGINITENGLGLISDEIRTGLDIDVSVLMGANIANEVARDEGPGVLSASRLFPSHSRVAHVQLEPAVPSPVGIVG